MQPLTSTTTTTTAAAGGDDDDKDNCPERDRPWCATPPSCGRLPHRLPHRRRRDPLSPDNYSHHAHARIRGAESGRGVGTPAWLRTPRKICTLPTRWRNSGARSPTRPGEFKILNPPDWWQGHTTPRSRAETLAKTDSARLRAGLGGGPGQSALYGGEGVGPKTLPPHPLSPSRAPVVPPLGIVRGAHTFPTWGDSLHEDSGADHGNASGDYFFHRGPPARPPVGELQGGAQGSPGGSQALPANAEVCLARSYTM